MKYFLKKSFKNKKGTFIISVLIMICAILCLGMDKVNASSLIINRIPNIYVKTYGGNKDPLYGQYGTFEINGKVVYCVEPGVEIITNSYDGEEGWGNSPYSSQINDRIQLIGYYGYGYPNHQTLYYRMATQALIWEEVSGQNVEFWTEEFGHGDFIDVSTERNEIMRLVNSHYNKPSFDNQSITIPIGEVSNIVDEMGVISDYEITNDTNDNVKINGNALSVFSKEVETIKVSLKKKTYTNDPTVIFVGINNKSQKMGFFGLNGSVDSEVTITSYAGSVIVEKLDRDNLTVKPRGDAKLSGAVYGVYTENDERIGQVTIGDNSLGKSGLLPKVGKFYLKEEQSSPGYTLDSTKYYFEISENNLTPTVTVYEKVIERNVEFLKVLADSKTGILKAEPNVKFEFYLKSNMSLYTSGTTDSNGQLKVTLPYGIYIVKQVNAMPGYEKVEDFELVINQEDEKPITKVISDAKISAKLRLVKVDKDSNKVLKKDGIKFKIKNLTTNEYICQNITYPKQEKVCIYETKGGYFVTPEALEIGDYQIEEVENQQIDGYLWNSEPIKFSINKDSDFIYDDEYGVIIEVKFTNKQVKGDIYKYGEKINIENSSFYYEKIKLNGVEYKLYAAANIYSGDGTLVYNANSLIGTYKTKDGYIKISNLYLGDYYLAETATVDGHTLDSTFKYFTLSYKDSKTPVVSLTLNLDNYLEKGTLEFHKSDLTTGKALPNTTIQIFYYDDNVEKAKLIFEGVTDKDGNITIDNLFIGKFYIVESKAPEGYYLNNEKIFFEIKENGEIIKANMLDEKIQAKLKLIKIDMDSKKVVVKDGIKFKIKNLKTGKYVCQYSNASSTRRTCTFKTIDGYFITPEPLEMGDYQIEEVENQNINGYLWNPLPLKFSIDENSDFIRDKNGDLIIEVKYENKQVKGEVEIYKYGEELVIKNDTYYYEKIKLDKVEYKLYASKDIYSGDGTLIYNADTLIGTYYTLDGYLKIDNLYLGEYYLVETATREDHVLDSTKKYFTLSYKDSKTPVISITLEMDNYLKKGTLIFTKEDLTTGESLPNTTIQIYSYKEEDDDGVLIFEGITDQNGNIKIDNLFAGKFYIVEIKAPDGYSLNTEKMFFEITENGEIVKADMTDEKVIFEVPNTFINETVVINIFSIISFGVGLGLVVYGKKKQG